MDLSIIIVSYNTKELLEKCLGSLGQYEIIVVDNGSTDGTVKKIKNEKELFLRNVKIIENKQNLGFAKAVNQGLLLARGKVVLLLNSDTQVKKGVLEKLLEFEKKVLPAIIGARLLNPDSSIQPSVFHLPTIKRAVLEYWFGKKGEFSKYAPSSEEPCEVEAVSGGAMMISKKVVEKIGLFDERYFMYFEDLDYCRRAQKAGFKVWYLPSAEIIHEHGASGREIAEEADQWRRLVPSSKIYHGRLKHYLINFVLWIGQKF